MRKTKTLKTIVLSLGLAAGMMLPASASAQGVFGDMLDNYYAEKEAQSSQGGGALLRGNDDPVQVSTSGSFYNEEFGAPLGSGVLLLLAAGIGYATLKKKEDEQ